MENTPKPTDFISYYKSLNLLEREHLAKNGVSKAQLMEFKDAFGLSFQQMADLMAITDRTLYLKKDTDLFSQIVSDRLLALLDFFIAAIKLFERPFMMLDWFTRPHPEISYLTPLRMMETHPGQQRVRELLSNMYLDNYEAAQRPNPIRFNSSALETDS